MAVHSWISFVKQYAKKHNLTYKEALKKASPEYRKYKSKRFAGADSVGIKNDKNKSMKKKPSKKRMKKKPSN